MPEQVYFVKMVGPAGESSIRAVASLSTRIGDESGGTYVIGRKVVASDQLRESVRPFGIEPGIRGTIIRLESPDMNRMFVEVLFDGTNHSVHCGEEEILILELQVTVPVLYNDSNQLPF